MATSISISPIEQRVTQAFLDEGFKLNADDGWFYPARGPDLALVRCTVYGGQYQIWRRRKLSTVWMLIATCDVEEFDLRHFHRWRETYQLTA